MDKSQDFLIEIKGNRSSMVDGCLGMVSRGEEGSFMELGASLFLIKLEERNSSLMELEKREEDSDQEFSLFFLFLFLGLDFKTHVMPFF